MGFRMLSAAAALVAVVLLAGCVPQEPVITPAPEPTSTPVFASDEEALAAATEAYAKYLEVSNRIRSNSSADLALISAYVTADRLPTEVEGFQEFRDKGYVTTGGVKFDNAVLQQYIDINGGGAQVVIYVCMDATSVHFVDAHGNEVTFPGRPDREQFEVAFESAKHDPALLLLARSELWPNDLGC